MKIFDSAVLDELVGTAAASPRRRMNLNIHHADDFPCHRFFNAMEPDSYIRPHRHLDPMKDETVIAIRGRVAVMTFTPDGAVDQAVILAPGAAVAAVDVRSGEWHCAVSLESGSIFLEAKAGPYVPITEAEKAPWAPAEGTPEAAVYVEKLRALFA